MFSLTLMAYAVLIVIAATIACVISQRARRVFTFRQGNEELCRAVRSAKRRFFVAVGFTAVVLLIGLIGTLLFPALLGLPVAVAPCIAGTAGLLLYAATPPPTSSVMSTDDRVASLKPRHLWSFAPTRTLVGLAILIGAMLALIIGTGLTSSPDDAGRYRAITFENETFASSATPYPGWFYGIPLIVALTLLLGAGLMAVHRIATTPSLPGAGLERQDWAWRVASTRIVTTLVAGTVSLQLGGVAVFAGNAIHNAALHPSVPNLTQAVGDTLVVAGFAMMGVSLVYFTLAALRAFGLPHTVAHQVATQGAAGENGTR